MTFPYDAPTLAAQTRLSSFYNGNDYDAGSNPGGMGAGGHRSNFIPSLQDVALLGDSIADAADAAEASADDASNAATTALGLATALTGTSVTSNSISTGSKAFTTQSAKAFDVGTYVIARSDANPTTHYMIGQVTAYSGTSLTVNMVSSSGSGTRTDWTILGRVGLPGSTGATGAQGIQGETPAIKYTFGSSTTDADPGSGIFLINNATYASATFLYFDNLDANGASQTTFLDAMDDSTNTALRGTLYMQQVDASSVYAVFNVTGAVTDGTGYRKVPVTPVMSNGTFTAGHQVAITFVRTGDKGADGAGAGDVLSDIGSATDQRIVVFNGTTGKHVTQSSFIFGTSGTAVGALSTGNTWGGTQSFAALLDAQASFRRSGALTPAQITSNQNDYAPTGHADVSVFRLSTDAARNITGLAGGASGRVVLIRNVGSFNINLVSDTSSSAANRFDLGTTPYLLYTGQALELIYDGTTSRWRPMSHTYGPRVITAQEAQAFAVGLSGATTPAFSIDSSTASSVTGLKIVSKAVGDNYVGVFATGNANAGISLSALGSGTLFFNAELGTETGEIRCGGTATVPASNNTQTLGTVTRSWGDLFLGSGAVINWNSGDMLLTHSANTLTLTGATGSNLVLTKTPTTLLTGDNPRALNIKAPSASNNQYSGIAFYGREATSICGIACFDDDTTGSWIIMGTSATYASGITQEGFWISPTGAIHFPAIGTTATTPNSTLISGNANQLLRFTSSMKVKNVVNDISEEESRDMLSKLRVFSYKSLCKADDKDQLFVGLGAEEVEKIDKRLVTYDKDGQPESVSYDRVGLMAIPAIVAMDRELRALRAEVEELRKH